jgi:hypothetical protein
MKHKFKWRPLMVFIFLISLFFLAGAVWAQTSGDYSLAWNTVDSGGGLRSTGGAYTLNGSIGQAEAGVVLGGAYSVAGGFWPSRSVNPLPPQHIYLPLIQN